MGSNLLLKILFIVPYAPNQIRTRSLNLIKALASSGHRITLATLWSDAQELEDIRRLAGILDRLIAVKIRTARSLWNCVKAIPSSQPVQAHYSWSPTLARKITRLWETENFDVVHVEHLRGVRYGLLLNDTMVRKGRMRPPVIWDSVDCISDLFRHASQDSCAFRARLTTRIELPRTEKYEGWLTAQFGRVLVTSESDRRGLLRLVEKRRLGSGVNPKDAIEERIVVVPNGVDLAYFSPPEANREPQTLVITGKMSYHANITAVVRFVEDVMPRIWARLPHARLWIVGKDPSPEIRRLGFGSPAGQRNGAPQTGRGDSRIRITGTVEDIRPFLRKAMLAVAPIRYGAGIQNKVLEAMACGTPVVATPEAIGALRAKPGQDLVVARDEEKLADSIISLLKDPDLCSSLGRAGRAFVEANHDWRLVAHGLTGIYLDART
jgi:glycosyltransferase involved in cell wall biosynthesis